MQDSQAKPIRENRPIRTITGSTASLLFIGSLLFAAGNASAAKGGVREIDGSGKDVAGTSVLAGVVRDAQGTVQMGALVQVLAADSVTVAVAFTDQHGRYVIPNLNPGRYLVRASATLFVPATKANLRLWAGTTTVANLTMAALFDTASWLPAQRRRAEETSDDWKWTLRSTAHRPILRIVEDGESIEVSSSGSEYPHALRAKAQGAVESGNGGFGQGGVHTIQTVHQQSIDGSADMIFRADLATVSRPPDGGVRPSASEFDLGYEAKAGYGGGATRTVVTYMAHPELIGRGFETGVGGGLQVLQMSSAQRINLGDRVDLEAGGRMKAVHAGASRIVARPFLRVTAHPGSEWAIEYRMSTDRELQEFDDVTTGGGEVPAAVVQDGKLALETGRHQELSASHRSGRSSIQAAYYHDALSRTAVSGGMAAPALAGVSDVTPQSVLPGYPIRVSGGMILDPITGSFRAIGNGYTTNGLRLSASSALTPSVWIAAEYSSGDALSQETNGLPPGTPEFAAALSELHAERSQSATVAVKGRLLGAGTRLRASYRWQPTRGVTAVDPYSAFSDQAYLSCLIRQSIRAGHLLPEGLEATVDVTNLLAQGYRPFLSADGQMLYFAQAPRTVQAGLSFTF